MIDMTLEYGYRIYNADDINIVLAKIDVVKNPKSKNYGKQIEKRIGYFGKLEHALSRYVDEVQKSNDVMISGNLDKILTALDEIKQAVKRVAKEVSE